MAVLARYLIPMVAIFLLSWLARAWLRRLLRRRSEPPKPPGESSARVVEGSYRVKDEEET